MINYSLPNMLKILEFIRDLLFEMIQNKSHCYINGTPPGKCPLPHKLSFFKTFILIFLVNNFYFNSYLMRFFTLYVHISETIYWYLHFLFEFQITYVPVIGSRHSKEILNTAKKNSWKITVIFTTSNTDFLFILKLSITFKWCK